VTNTLASRHDPSQEVFTMTKKTRRRFNAEQRAEILRDYHQSGLSKEAFARQRGLHSSMLGNWLRKEKGADTSPPSLIPVRVKPPESPAEPPSFEVVLRGGISIRVARGFDAELLRQLVDTLERCCR